MDGAPQIVLLTDNFEKDLIQVPCITGLRPPPLERIGVALPEFTAPFADGLIADNDAPRGENLLNLPIAQGEAEVARHCVGDNLGREPMTLVGGRRGMKSGAYYTPLPQSGNLDLAFQVDNT